MNYIKGFDTLRALSIILVILTHLGLYTWLPEDTFVKQNVWRLISGATGVQIFFTLSGFLITNILFNEVHKHDNINLRIFYIRRFLRLLPPLVILYSVLFFLMKTGEIKYAPEALLYSIFYLYNFVPMKHYTGELGHTWSLALEEQYYLIWPVILNFIKSKKVLYALTFIILGLCLYALLHLYPTLSFGANYKTSRWFIPAIAPVMIGSLFAILNHETENALIVRYRQHLLTLAIGITLFCFPLYSSRALLKYSFMIQPFGVSIFLVWIKYNQDSILTRMLDNSLLAYIGKISYGLYVYQGLFLRTGPSGQLWIQQYPQNIILTISTAILSYHLLEKPILSFKKRFTRAVKSA